MPTEPTEGGGDSNLADLNSDESRLHLAAVGSVAGTWALFESFLDTLALELAGIDKAGLCLTAQIAGSSRKLDAYIAIARLLGCEKLAGDFEKFAKDTAGLAERRNRVVHDPWLMLKGQLPQRMEVTARKKLRSQMVPVSTLDILALDENIRAHIIRFLNLHGKVKSEIGASSETPP